jgi:hypothetical protein
MSVRRIVRVVAVLLAVLLLPLLIGVWLPDVFINRVHVLAEGVSSSGYKFQVVQYWNHVDFYSTELHVIGPDGTIEKRPLDSDDNKSWSVPLTINEQQKRVTIVLGGNRVREESWGASP